MLNSPRRFKFAGAIDLDKTLVASIPIKLAIIEQAQTKSYLSFSF